MAVTDAQAAALTRVFGSAEAYRHWLRDAIRSEVRARTAQARYEAAFDQIEADAQAAADEVLPEGP
jgi:hypothetical protein